MDIKISIELKDKCYGFSDLLDGRELNNQTKKEIIELIKEDIGYVFDQQIEVEAINYTHCCKSDSELLKDKQKLSFEDWYRTYGYEKSVTGNFVKEGTRYTLDEMKFKYEYNMP